MISTHLMRSVNEFFAFTIEVGRKLAMRVKKFDYGFRVRWLGVGIHILHFHFHLVSIYFYAMSHYF